MRFAGHGLMVVLLTVVTQLGGIAWLLGLMFRRWVLAFVVLYAVLWGAAQMVAPQFGRVPVPCFGQVLRMQSPVYCVLMRNFVTPDLRDVAGDAASAVATVFPGTVTLALDGSFPFGDGVTLIPHLSHDDGEKLDFAFYYTGPDGYVPGVTASPLGYFAFERVGQETCPDVWPSLRWDMGWFQPLVRDLRLEPDRTRLLLLRFVQDARVSRVFVEPPLAQRLGVAADKLRFQGCRAARHDDHIHIQL